MIKKFTFTNGIEIEYEDNLLFQHRLIVNTTEIGPWISKHNKMLTYELCGRYFVCQIMTDLLPLCFELIKPKEIRLETIEP